MKRIGTIVTALLLLSTVSLGQETPLTTNGVVMPDYVVAGSSGPKATESAVVEPPAMEASGADALEPAALPVVLVLHPEGEAFSATLQGIVDGLQGEVTIESRVIPRDASEAVVVQAVTQVVPRVVVLMENRVIGLWRRSLEQGLGRDAPPLPSLSLMALQIPALLKGIPNAAGISYEVPAMTALVNLRNVTGRPMRRVGVVHRASMSEFVALNARFSAGESIELVARSLPDDSDLASGLRTSLEDLMRRPSVEALWVPLDNALLNVQMLQRVWIPFLQRNRVPVVVGVESLVQSRIRFGSLAVLPDHYGLGSQAADKLREILEADGSAEGMGVDMPLSVVKVLNRDLLRATGSIVDARLGEIDRFAE